MKSTSAIAALSFIAASALCVSSASAKLPSLTFPAGVMPPPLSVKASRYYQSHPDRFAALVAGLTPSGRSHASNTPRSLPPPGGNWTAMVGAPVGLCGAHLMHNGNVLAHQCNTPHWYRLVPDKNARYTNGTWTQIADLPVINGTQYVPLYYASAVLPDGRLLIEGGEYNGSGTQVWTNMGAIYSQYTNTWTPVSPPSGVTQIGDAASASLKDGRFLLGTCCDNPAQGYLFNPATLTWSSTGAPTGSQYGQGYELLQSGRILTVDVSSAPGTQLYSWATRGWTAGSNVPVVLADTCGTNAIGPAVVRGNDTVVAFGGDTCGVNPVPTTIRDNATGQWSVGPTIPAICGTDGTTPCDAADAPAAQLYNGDVLFAASAGYGNAPTHFFEMTLIKNNVAQWPDHPEAASRGAYTFSFLEVPTGQIMVTDGSHAYLYNPSGSRVWNPGLSSWPSVVTRGVTYTITGTQMNGRSAGAYQGNAGQSFTNFPILRVGAKYVNVTGFSTFSIAKGVVSSFQFVVPKSFGTGRTDIGIISGGDGGYSTRPLITIQ